MRFFLAVAAALATGISVAAVANDIPNKTTWLQREYETSSENSDGGSSGSSGGRQALIETAIEDTPEGVVLRYDYPRHEDGTAKSNFWYFPADVIERPDGSIELLDIQSVEARINQWLQERKIPREACGLWSHGGGFPYKVDCDPSSVLKQIESFDLRIKGLEEGAKYLHSLGSSPGILERLPFPRSGYSVTVFIDQGIAQAGEVERALILAQMHKEELSREQVESDATKIMFEGSITIEFDIDSEGSVIKMTERTNLIVSRPDEGSETKTSLVTVERYDMETAKVTFGL